MAYIIGIALILIAIMVTGLIMRKKVYDGVDRLEDWKMNIMNRDVAGELARIKKLNLSGETQEKFETWKEQWENIVATELPDIEEYLFDAESAADRYRFPTAKRILNQADKEMQDIEQKINDMLNEVNELIESEQMSREDIEKIEPDLKQLHKKLSQNRQQFGHAEAHFEQRIDDLEGQLNQYHELSSNGNYLEARQLVEGLKEELNNLTEEIEAFPSIYRKCKYDLPKELEELKKGISEMKEDGYRVEHLDFEQEADHYKAQLHDIMESLDKGDTSQANTLVSDIEERLKDMYEQLENEALAKNYVDTNLPVFEQSLAELIDSFSETKEEVTRLKQSYYFEESDMENYHALDKSISQLRNLAEDISDKLANDETVSHSYLRTEIEHGFNELESLQNDHDIFRSRLDNLRQDEIEAKEQLEKKRQQLYDVNRRLTKSNIPGVPTFIWNKWEDALEKNNQVLQALEKQPLDIAKVQTALKDAEKAVDDVMEETETMLDQAYLTEQVIQYANRYRSRNPGLAHKLTEAERLFRSYEYELALEYAANAVEEVEPGALKRIEAFQKEAN